MRTSSIKSLVSTLTIVATLMLAVPVAEARAAQPRTGRGDTIVQAVIKLLKRVGRVTANAGPSIPQEPDNGAGNDTNPGTSPTTGGPAQ